MGVSSDQLQQGILDFGKVIVHGMQTFDRLKSAEAPAAAQAKVSQPAVANQQVVATQPMTPAKPSLAAVPAWAWLAGGVGLLWYFRRRL